VARGEGERYRVGAAGRFELGKTAAKGKRKGSSRAIDAPSVGRMDSGMLKLSKRDGRWTPERGDV
jgi:hypothetical protein